MSGQPDFALHMLPLELFYRILSHLEIFDVFVSLNGICRRLDQMIDSYTPYQVDIT